MSEQEPRPQFDPLEQARIDAGQADRLVHLPANQQELYNTFMAPVEKTDTAGMSPREVAEVTKQEAEQARQAATELVDYLSSRPVQELNNGTLNPNGTVKHPESGEEVTASSYFDQRRNDHYDATLAETYDESKDYDQMGMFEVARKLAQAELSGADNATQKELAYVLNEKIEAEAGRLKTGEGKTEPVTSKGPRSIALRDHNTHELTGKSKQVEEISNEDPQANFKNRILRYKDEYKEKIQGVSGGAPAESDKAASDTSKPATEQPPRDSNSGSTSKPEAPKDGSSLTPEQEEFTKTRDRIDEGYSQTVLNTLKNMGIPDDIIKDLPPEYFYARDDKDHVNIAQELPDSIRDYIIKKEQEAFTKTRDRIDPEYSSYVMHTLKDANIPDEILKNLPPEYFYYKDDPDFKDIDVEQPEELREWLRENLPEVLDPDATQPTEVQPKDGQDKSGYRNLPFRERVKLWRTNLNDPENSVNYLEGNWNGRNGREARRERRRFTLAAIGGAALAVLGVYGASKGFHFGGGGSGSREQATQVSPLDFDIKTLIKTAIGNTSDLSGHVGGHAPHASGEAVSHAHNAAQAGVEASSHARNAVHASVEVANIPANNFEPQQGEGITQIMSHWQESRGLTPAQFHQVYEQANAAGLIDHANTYTMPNGDLGILDPGSPVRMNKEAIIKLIETVKSK